MLRAALVLLVLATAPWAALGSAAAGEQGLVRLVVDAVAPRLVTADGPGVLTVTGRAVGTGDRVVTDLAVRVQRDDPLGDDATVRAALRDVPEAPYAPRFTDVPGELAPGGSVEFRVDVPLRGDEADSLALTAPGVYPLLVNLNGAPESGDQARLASAPLLLPVLALPAPGPTDPVAPDPIAPDPPAPAPPAPVPLTVLWPLVGAPAQLPTGIGAPLLLAGDAAGADPVAAELAPGGRLDGLVTALEREWAPGSALGGAVCVVVDPELLETVDAMGRGYRVAGPDGEVPGAGGGDARRWLDRVRAVVAGRCVLALPYADPDVVALSRVGLADLQALAASTGARLVTDLLGVQPAAGVAWPPGGVLDERTLADLAALGTRSVVLEQRGVAAAPDGADVVRLGAAGPRGATGLLTDPLLAEALETGDVGGSGSAVAAQDALGVLVHRVQRGGRAVLLAPPRRWDAPPGEAAELLRTARVLVEAGLAAPRDLAGAAGSGTGTTTLAYPVPSAELPATVTAEVAAARDVVRDLQAATTRDATVGVEPAALLDPIRLALLRASSSAWRVDPGRASALVAAASGQLRGLRGAVRLLPSTGAYTLASSDAPLLVTVGNDLPVTVSVQLAVDAVPGLRVGPVGAQQVPARSTRQFVLPAEVTRTGQFTVGARVSTPDGTPLGSPTTLQLRSTAFGTVTVALTGGAGAVLVLLVGRRVVRRVRAARGRGAAA